MNNYTTEVSGNKDWSSIWENTIQGTTPGFWGLGAGTTAGLGKVRVPLLLLKRHRSYERSRIPHAPTPDIKATI